MSKKHREAIALAEQIIRNVEKIEESDHFLVIGPDAGTADYLIAMQIGYAILLDKPVIVMVPKGRHIAERLLRIADYVVDFDKDEEAMTKAVERLHAIMRQ